MTTTENLNVSDLVYFDASRHGAPFAGKGEVVHKSATGVIRVVMHDDRTISFMASGWERNAPTGQRKHLITSDEYRLIMIKAQNFAIRAKLRNRCANLAAVAQIGTIAEIKSIFADITALIDRLPPE